jgi:hypothetical protein
MDSSFWQHGMPALSNQKDLESPNNPLIVYAPVWAIVLLAIYGIGSIGYGVAVFEDMPRGCRQNGQANH